MTLVYDLSDPANPVKLREFSLVGQQPGATGAVPPAIHGLISTGPKGNRVYLAFGARFEDTELQPLRTRRFAHSADVGLFTWKLLVHQEGERCGLGNQLGNQLNPLAP